MASGSRTKCPVLPSPTRAVHGGSGFGSGRVGACSFRSSTGAVNFRSTKSNGNESQRGRSAEVSFHAAPSASYSASYSAPSASYSETTASNARKVTAQLQALGLAGVLSYGLLNTLYYSVAFLAVWSVVAKVWWAGCPCVSGH